MLKLHLKTTQCYVLGVSADQERLSLIPVHSPIPGLSLKPSGVTYGPGVPSPLVRIGTYFKFYLAFTFTRLGRLSEKRAVAFRKS